jgi:hypothetical protein
VLSPVCLTEIFAEAQDENFLIKISRMNERLPLLKYIAEHCEFDEALKLANVLIPLTRLRQRRVMAAKRSREDQKRAWREIRARGNEISHQPYS